MAQKLQVLFIDDIDGGEAEGTVLFGLDGKQYEIDLNAKHSEDLRAALALYVENAREAKPVTPRRGRGTGTSRRGSSGIDTSAVRTWARDNGIELKERGRIPADVVQQYETAHR